MEYVIIGAILLILLVWLFSARTRVQTLYNKYSRIPNEQGINGKQLAFYAKEKLELHDLEFSLIDGKLTDCYVPSKKLLCLSEEVANNASLASVAIVAHELGHAEQHYSKDAMFVLNNLLARITRITSKFILPLLVLGLISYIFKWPSVNIATGMLMASGILFLIQVVFKLLVIPVEINASTRALDFLTRNKIITKHEIPKAKKLLRTAGNTYIVGLFDGLIIPIKKFNNKLLGGK